MRTQIVITAAVAMAFGVTAAEKFKADGEKGSAKKLFNARKVIMESDEKVYSVKGHDYLSSKEIIEIVPGKKYVIKGKFRSPSNKPKPFYLGFILLDVNKKVISPAMVAALPKTETTLVEACKKTDTVLKLKDASKWKKHPAAGVAFKADPTGKCADLPNSNLSSMGGRGITSVKKVGDIWEVTLKKPVGKAFPAGTVVREHLLYGGYMYCAASSKRPAKQMKEYKSKVISEMAESGAISTKWWPGTKYAKVIIITNYGDKKGESVTEFDDIVVEELD
jgi:hypothetical protein